MPRILIADDNSNIQRMAALALKDAGIEVVAVGNGEAAVRKIAEIGPDLVLADIFMPVRNGYEVCEFVKHDPRYAQTPVVLLVGAFDPFDEQEAQRVQADGVLKKPFVPPDPLINTVKALLAKSAGDRLVAVTVPVAAEVSVGSGTGNHGNASQRAHEVPAAEFSDVPPEEFSLPSAKLDLEGHEGAIAFASLLQSPAETEEIEPVVTANRDASLGEPAFWTQPAETQPTDEAPADDFTTEHPWTSGERAVPEQGEAPSLAPLLPDLEPLQEIARGEASPTEQTQETPGTANDLPAPTQELFAPRDASTGDTTPLPLDPAVWETAALEASFPGEPAATLSPTEGPLISLALIVSAASQSENAPIEDEVPAPKGVEKAAAEFLDVPAGDVPTKPAKPTAEAHAAPLLEALVDWPAEFAPAISPSAEAPVSPMEHASATQPIPSPTESRTNSAPAPAAAPAVSPEVVEAMVQRVIAQMQPQIDNLTREILRPAVETLIRRELEKR